MCSRSRSQCLKLFHGIIWVRLFTNNKTSCLPFAASSSSSSSIPVLRPLLTPISDLDDQDDNKDPKRSVNLFTKLSKSTNYRDIDGPSLSVAFSWQVDPRYRRRLDKQSMMTALENIEPTLEQLFSPSNNSITPAMVHPRTDQRPRTLSRVSQISRTR